MKSRLPLFLLTLLLFSVVSCTKELSKETGSKTGSSGDFYATINGNLWNADSLQLVLVSSGGVTINGLSKTGEQISMILPTFKVGTYTLSSSSASYALYANLLDNLSNVFVSNTGLAGGTVTISSIDTINHLVSGSFQFNLINPGDNSTKTITKGIFDYIPYSGGEVINPPPGTGADTLKAIIDGSPFIADQIQATVAPSPGGGPSQLLISGISGNLTQDISILIPSAIGAGTYKLDFSTGQFVGLYYPNVVITQEVLLSDANGSLTILSNDTVARRVKGTFSFKATSLTSSTTANITQGYFAVSY